MFKLFPEFTIDSIIDVDCIGRVDASKWVGEGWLVAIRLDDRIVWGRFVQADKATGAVRVRMVQVGDIDALRVGRSYPFIGSYWGNQAEVVLDRARTWHRETFQPVDAVQYRGADHRIMAKATPEQEGGTLVPGGWDHEHCELCFEKIGHGGVPQGWTDGQDTWLCESCYIRYVVPRSLEFIPIE